MNTDSTLPSDSSFDSILAAMIESQEQGANQSIDIAAWTERYPQHADQIRSFFNNRGQFEAVIGPRQPAQVEPPTIGLDDKRGEASVGQRIRYFGDYELLEEIARGGMGVVFKARQVSLNRVVALKMILSGQLAGASDVQRFQGEAEAAANLDHPHIVPIYEVGVFEGQHYFSMKLIEGGNLSQAKNARPSTETQKDHQKWVASLVAQVARAVHHAHQRGILHRDLKPGNILLDAEGVPHVTDFGLAKKVEGGSDLTNTGAIVGTPAYMAPEQARCEKGLSTAADVYSLGAILYELLTSRPPFQGVTPLDTILEVLEKEPPKPTSLNAAIDRDLETITLKCLEKNPAKRYGSAEALAEELERFQNSEPILARRSTWWEQTTKWAQRKPAIAAMTAALLLILLIGMVSITTLSVYAIRNADRAEREAEDARLQSRRADENRVLAEQREQAERRTSYANRIARAHREWQSNQVSQAERILEECPSDLRSWEWNYLRRICHPERREFPSQDKDHISQHVSTGGGKVAAVLQYEPDKADKNGLAPTPKKIMIWDANKSTVLREISPKGKSVQLAALSSDGQLLAVTYDISSSQETRTEVAILDADTGNVLFSMPAKEHVEHLSASLTHDGRRLVWLEHSTPPQKEPTCRLKSCDARTGQGVEDLLTALSINCVAFTLSPNAQHLAMLSTDRKSNTTAVELWDLSKKQKTFKLNSAKDIAGVAFSTNSQQLASGHADGLIQLWDVATGKVLKQLHGHKDVITSLAFNHDNSRLVSGGFDAQIKVWNTETGKEIMTIRGDGWVVDAIALDPKEGWATASGIGVPIRVWDISNNPEHVRKAINEKVDESDFLIEASFSPDSQKVLLQHEKRVRLLDMSTAKPIFELSSLYFGFFIRAEMGPICFHQQNAFLSSSLFKTAKKLDVYTREASHGKVQSRVTIDLGPICPGSEFEGELHFSHDGKQLIAVASSAEVAIWNLTEVAQPVKRMKLVDLQMPVRSWLSPNNRYLAVVDQKAVVVYDLATELVSFKRIQCRMPVVEVRFSHDGKVMVLRHEKDNQMTTYDNVKNTVIREMTLAGKGVADVILSSDGERLMMLEYVTSGTALVRIFDVASAQELCALPIQLSFSLAGMPFIRMLNDHLYMVWVGRPFAGDEGNTGWIIWNGSPVEQTRGK